MIEPSSRTEGNMGFKRRLIWIILTLTVAFAFLGLYYQDSLIAHRSPIGSHSQHRGVVFHDRWRSWDGYNIVSFIGGQAKCAVFDMDGKIILQLEDSLCVTLPDGGYVVAGGDLKRFDRELRELWTVEENSPLQDLSFDARTGETFILVHHLGVPIGGERVNVDEI